MKKKNLYYVKCCHGYYGHDIESGNYNATVQDKKFAYTYTYREAKELADKIGALIEKADAPSELISPGKKVIIVYPNRSIRVGIVVGCYSYISSKGVFVNLLPNLFHSRADLQQLRKYSLKNRILIWLASIYQIMANKMEQKRDTCVTLLTRFYL
jgi:acyl-CoA synthetase (AMP-forming)/AMP-acid ligase II